jgi:hypothetical protein
MNCPQCNKPTEIGSSGERLICRMCQLSFRFDTGELLSNDPADFQAIGIVVRPPQNIPARRRVRRPTRKPSPLFDDPVEDAS